jgi:hypothetical protein
MQNRASCHGSRGTLINQALCDQTASYSICGTEIQRICLLPKVVGDDLHFGRSERDQHGFLISALTKRLKWIFQPNNELDQEYRKAEKASQADPRKIMLPHVRQPPVALRGVGEAMQTPHKTLRQPPTFSGTRPTQGPCS